MFNKFTTKVTLAIFITVTLLTLCYWGMGMLVLSYYKQQMQNVFLVTPPNTLLIENQDQLNNPGQNPYQQQNGTIEKYQSQYTAVMSFLDYYYPLLSFIFALIISIVSLFIGHYLAKIFIKPVNLIATDLDKVDLKDLSFRLKSAKFDLEMQQLIGKYNLMLSRIERGVTNQKQFIQDVAHELKTPLAILQTNIDLLRTEAKVPSGEPNAYANIENSIYKLSKMIKDLALLNSDNLVYAKKELDIGLFLKELLSGLHKIAIIHHVVIKYKFPENKYLIKSDKYLLEELFSNLIINAVKYSKAEGEVNIDLFRENRKIIVIIRDNGIGISANDLPFIFDRFYRTKDRTVKLKEGSGLGLAIVKKIANNLNILIEVSSKNDQGTSFKLTFPE